MPTGAELAEHVPSLDVSGYESSRLMREELLAADAVDWRQAFEDPTVLGRVVRDILEVATQPREGKRGRRPPLERNEETLAVFRQLVGDDPSPLPLPETLDWLLRARRWSLKSLAARTDLSESQLGRLRRGDAPPSMYEIAQLAAAFKKRESYFLEYRIAFITAGIAARLRDIPEASVRWYEELSRPTRKRRKNVPPVQP